MLTWYHDRLASRRPSPRPIPRRRLLQTSVGAFGLSLPEFFQLKDLAASISAAESSGARAGQAKSCIVLYCWGGMSHHETWDPKPSAPAGVRGEFKPIDTATPGVRIGEHLPHLAKQTQQLAIIRSIHHSCTAHGKAMYWNMTGHPPPQPAAAVNLPPSQSDWPSLGAMIAKLRAEVQGVPPAVRLPYPLVDNNTLQAGEYGGWLGSRYDPIVVRTPGGKPFGGVSRDLGSPVLNMAEGIDHPRLESRRALLAALERDANRAAKDVRPFDYFRQLAMDMLLSPRIRQAFDLEREPKPVRQAYGDHLCGRSILLARRLTDVGVPM